MKQLLIILTCSLISTNVFAMDRYEVSKKKAYNKKVTSELDNYYGSKRYKNMEKLAKDNLDDYIDFIDDYYDEKEKQKKKLKPLHRFSRKAKHTDGKSSKYKINSKSMDKYKVSK